MSINFTVFERKGRQGWWYQFSEDGKRSSPRSVAALAKTLSMEGLPQNTRRQCERIVREGIARGAVGHSVRSSRGQLVAYLLDYWDYGGERIRRRNRLKAGAISEYYAGIMRGYIANHIAPLVEGSALSDVSPHMVDDVRNQLIDGGSLANATIAKIMTAFTQPLREAYKSGAIYDDPTRLLDPIGVKPERRRGMLERSEVQSLLRLMSETADRRVYLAVLLAATTGMRLGEIRALTRGDISVIDAENAMVAVRHSWSAAGYQKSTKGKKERLSPVPTWVATKLIDLSRDGGGDIVFWSDSGGKPLSAGYLRDATYNCLYDVLEKGAGMEVGSTVEVGGKTVRRGEVIRRERNIVFHSFRHFFATEAQALGVDGDTLRRSVGHESQAMTDQYTHESFELVKGVARVAAEIAGEEDKE